MTEDTEKRAADMTDDELHEAILDAQDEMLTAWHEAAAGVRRNGFKLMDDVLAAAEQGKVDAVRWVDARQRHSDLFEERRSRGRMARGKGRDDA